MLMACGRCEGPLKTRIAHGESGTNLYTKDEKYLGSTRRSSKVGREAEAMNVRMIVASWNSYDKHFGKMAVEEAERDALGECIQIIRDLSPTHEFLSRVGK